MKTLYTIGFTKKTAKQFFELLKENHVDILIDTRISNNSQLAGFAKEDDLKYFLKEIADIIYSYRPDFAPTKELLKDWRDKKITWDQYETQYTFLQEQRKTYRNFLKDYETFNNPCILCSEDTPEFCHRRLLADLIKKAFSKEVEIKHL